jgi:CobQ-like glutamine amidotransferase family enzyme
LLQAISDRALPRADLYTLGGGEDAPQVQASERLGDEGVLAEAVAEGAVVLAVCAGYQIIGTAFPAADGAQVPGLGLLEVSTQKGPGRRAVGEVVVEAAIPALGRLTGFENHGGLTTLGIGMSALGTVISGVGNGQGTDGAWAGRVVGTYLHGPVLARNPALADLLLSWAAGTDGLAPLDDRREQELRAERLGAVLSRRPARRRRRPG